MATPLEPVATAGAPGVIGPYSQAIKAGGFLFASGQIPLDPTTGTLTQGGITAQAHQVLENLGAVLKEAGVSFDRVVKTTVYLANMADFPAVNDVYATYFPAPAPARATIQAAGLPRNVLIEIDLVAYLGS